MNLKHKNYYYISEVAKVLGISKNTVLAWEKKGYIKSIRTKEGYRLFSKKDIDNHYAAYNWELKQAKMAEDYASDPHEFFTDPAFPKDSDDWKDTIITADF